MPYQVIARKFRPQTFKEMRGQEAIVTTLKNSIQMNRLSSAYLFSGPRGTGKTTLARLLAKAINCSQLTDDKEPCNQCSSCLEIQSGTSLDVLEIDGASHRGIDDIRKINETVGFSTSSGKYKVYLIDEVHMLTKEAFNALLKTLEEPPPKVKFFFATTEPHKVLPTILSRCQRFQLKSLPAPIIKDKLKMIAEQMGLEVEDEVFNLVSKRAEGGMRDAESLFDQMINFHDGPLTHAHALELLGLHSNEIFFELDLAILSQDHLKAIEIAGSVFASGKNLSDFIECWVEHFRTHLLTQLKASVLTLSETDRQHYETHAPRFSRDCLFAMIDYLLEVEGRCKTDPLNLASLEAHILKVLRLSQTQSIETLLKKIMELESKLGNVSPSSTVMVDPTPSPADLKGVKPAKKAVAFTAQPVVEKSEPVKKEEQTFQQHLPPSAKFDTLIQFAAVELEGRIIRK